MRDSIRKQVIEMVLATDMKHHFSTKSLFGWVMRVVGRQPANI